MAPGATAYESQGKSNLVDDDLWSVLRNAFDEDPPDDILQWLSNSGYTTWCTFTFMSPDEIPKYEDNQLPLSNCSISVLRRLNEKIRYAFERNEQGADQASFYTKKKICAVTRKSRKRKAVDEDIDGTLRLKYFCSAAHGIPPQKFRARSVVDQIVEDLPTDLSKDGLHILLQGPPRSGKTSILGKLMEILKPKYPDVPVFYVCCVARDRQDIFEVISRVEPCCVLLDDSDHWYDFDDFWKLFKKSTRLFINAAKHPKPGSKIMPPVAITAQYRTNLTDEESNDFLQHLKIDKCHHTNLKAWFGDNYYNYKTLVPSLMEIWEERKKEKSDITLHETYYQAQTIRKVGHGSDLLWMGAFAFLYNDAEFIDANYMGKPSRKESTKMFRYGIFDEYGKWSYDFVCRKYFAARFHGREYDSSLFDEHQGIPGEVDLLKKGLEHFDWTELKEIALSTRFVFPSEIEPWEDAFYNSISEFIPRTHTFCKKIVAKFNHEVSFVLRNNGSKRVIDFVLTQDAVGAHERLEAGLFESYLVVELKPRCRLREERYAMAYTETLRVASMRFAELDSTTRKKNHAVCLVSTCWSWFYLFTYNCEKGIVEESYRGTPGISRY